MTKPDELRAAAERHYHCLSSERDVDAFGRDAARRLADVIEYAERITGSNRADSPYVLERASHQSALRILAFAHGETNERESHEPTR